MLKIVLTGGPCAGKSQALNRLTQVLEARGYFVGTVFEAATALILNGIRPSENVSMNDFQRFVLDMQLNNEDLFEQVSKYYDPNKVIIFYDRGIMDSCAYVDKETVFKPMIEERGMTFADIYARYDAVLHLVTAADGAEEFYQWNDPEKEDTGNNAARLESPKEARYKDKKTLNAWIGHPHLRVFDNSTDFDGKINRIMEEVFALLGEPVPTEIERKFLIKMPTAEQIKALGCVSKANIIQTYLTKEGNVAERRIRQRGDKKNGFTFYYTEKTDVSTGVRIEDERKITPEEYLQLLTEADTSLHQISKIRHCFVYNKKYFEMDIYPFSTDYAIVEIELNNINEAFEMPPLEFIKEVTDDARFRNSELAKTLAFNLDGINVPVTETTATQWIYETGREELEILGSGVHRYNVVRTADEKEAFELSKTGARNYIARMRKVNGETVRQWYDLYSKTWIE